VYSGDSTGFGCYGEGGLAEGIGRSCGGGVRLGYSRLDGVWWDGSPVLVRGQEDQISTVFFSVFSGKIYAFEDGVFHWV
jgi:hypothetical protein